MDIEQIRKTLNSLSGKALKKHLLMRLYELKDIENLKDLGTPTHQALEIKAQKKAYLKLKEIFEELMTFDEEVREKDPADSYIIE